MRPILEIENAGLAAAQATAEDIALLQQAVTAMAAAQDAPALLAARDADFHRLLAKITHNPLLEILLESIFDVLREYILLMVPHLDPRHDVLPYHVTVFECVDIRPLAEGDEVKTTAAQKANEGPRTKPLLSSRCCLFCLASAGIPYTYQIHEPLALPSCGFFDDPLRLQRIGQDRF